MKRIYYINGKKTELKYILNILEQLLLYSGDTKQFEELGIDFEDIEE